MDLAGDWVGAYIDPRYDDSVFPLRAKFELFGIQIKGTMIDERTVLSEPIESVMRRIPENSPNGPSWTLFAERFPDAVLTSHWPLHSDLKGAVRGDTIGFNKYYVGSLEMTWSAVGLKSVTETLKVQPIVYEGTLNSDSGEIKGTWSVYETSLGGLVRRVVASGPFWLKKGW